MHSFLIMTVFNPKAHLCKIVQNLFFRDIFLILRFNHLRQITIFINKYSLINTLSVFHYNAELLFWCDIHFFNFHNVRMIKISHYLSFFFASKLFYFGHSTHIEFFHNVKKLTGQVLYKVRLAKGPRPQ